MLDQNIFSRKLESLITQDKESAFFPELSAQVFSLCEGLKLKQDIIATTLDRLWLPTALELAVARKNIDRTLIQGILGGQGTGKSTLCLILKLILHNLGFSVANLSLDDLYLTYDQRQKLKQQDPRLIWRGPPGTHDIQLGLQVMEQCLQGDSDSQILLPRFDKSAFSGSGDRTEDEAIEKPDILLFEGWFVGLQPIAKSYFNHPPAPIITPEDRQFAWDNNERLRAYLPLWSKLDRLIVLYPEDYRFSKQWRKEAEHKMIAAGKTGMSDEAIEHFVEYFWQALHPELFTKPLISQADLVVEIKEDHSLGKIHKKGAK